MLAQAWSLGVRGGNGEKNDGDGNCMAGDIGFPSKPSAVSPRAEGGGEARFSSGSRGITPPPTLPKDKGGGLALSSRDDGGGKDPFLLSDDVDGDPVSLCTALRKSLLSILKIDVCFCLLDATD